MSTILRTIISQFTSAVVIPKTAVITTTTAVPINISTVTVTCFGPNPSTSSKPPAFSVQEVTTTVYANSTASSQTGPTLTITVPSNGKASTVTAHKTSISYATTTTVTGKFTLPTSTVTENATVLANSTTSLDLQTVTFITSVPENQTDVITITATLSGVDSLPTGTDIPSIYTTTVEAPTLSEPLSSTTVDTTTIDGDAGKQKPMVAGVGGVVAAALGWAAILL